MGMKRLIITLFFLLLSSCTSYKDAIQGRWELTEIKNENGIVVHEACTDDHCDVVELAFDTEGNVLTVTAIDASGKETKAMYRIKEDGRLVSTGDEKPNMYILDLDGNKVVLIDMVLDEESGKFVERMLVFKKK